MDIKTVLHNLREDVSCSVCSDVFTDPKQLPCLHIFCLHCLKQWQRTSHGCDTIRCPKCQAVSKAPESCDLKDLPTSFYLTGLIDVLAIKEYRRSSVRCGNCDKKSSETSYCFHCCMFYCQECVIGHNIMRRNKDHRILALKDFQDKDYEDVLKRPLFCPKQGHTQEELKFFCKDCETAVCQTCVTLGHRSHTMNLIQDAAETQKIQIKSMVDTQRIDLKAKMNIIHRLDEDFAKLIQQGENVKRDVQRIVDNLIAVIEAKKQNIFSVVENQTSKSLESLTKRKNKIEEQIAVIELSLEKAEKLLTRSINAEIVQLKKSLESIFEGVDKTESIDGGPETLLVRLTFVENQKLLNLVYTEEIGSLENLHQSQTKASQCKERTVGSVGSEGRYKVTVKVHGGHVFRSPFTIKRHPFQVRPVLSFGSKGSSVGMFQSPWGVAVNARDEIAVSDQSNHRVQIFSSDGNYLRSFGWKGNKNGELIHPRGIAFHQNGNIFVVDSGNSRIQIFSGEGKYVSSFGGKGSLDSQLSGPLGLSVDGDGNIIVADAGNKLIKIFSPEGKFLMKIGWQGAFTFPVHCVQCDRYLIVSDYDEHCMKVYDRNGNFQYKLGKQGGGDGEIFKPNCLSVNNSGQLMVCESGNDRIQVFELNGKFLGKFGTNGSNFGELISPRSVAVLSNGRIVVSDFRNHSIHIFE